MRLYTTANLIAECRSLLDETNQDAVGDVEDILPSLNRAQDYAFDIYSRKYPEPILRRTQLELESGVDTYDIPEDCLEDRILKVDILVGGQQDPSPVRRISYRDASQYYSAATTATPYYYYILGREIVFVGKPSGAWPAQITYARETDKLVLPAGRVTRLVSASRYVILADLDEDLVTTESDQLGSYVNWVDGSTGVVKATLQIQSIVDSKVTFRSTPQRTSVLGRTVTGELPSDAELDDYLCPVDGICVPYYGKPTCNFLVLYAVAELGAVKLGGDKEAPMLLLEKFEKQVERTWVGREKQTRVQKRSNKWGSRNSRRYPRSQE